MSLSSIGIGQKAEEEVDSEGGTASTRVEEENLYKSSEDHPKADHVNEHVTVNRIHHSFFEHATALTCSFQHIIESSICTLYHCRCQITFPL